MNKNLYKRILMALMIGTFSTSLVLADSPTAPVVPVNLDQAAQTAKQDTPKKAAKTAKEAATPKVRPVDITPELREELAQQITDMSAKNVQKYAANQNDPVLVIGQVKGNQSVDLTLPKTVQLALDYNRDIKVAHYDLQNAEYAINEAKAGKMPSVSYSFDAGRGSSNTQLGTKIGNSFTNGISVNIPIYTGGLVEGNIAVAKLGKTNAQEEILRVEQATKLSAVQGYFGLLAYEELRDVYNESVANLQGHLDNVTAQYNVGTVAKLDVLTSDVSLANAKTDAVTAENNVSNAEANLNNILGFPLQTKLVLSDHQLPFDTYNISLQEALDYAMKYRPEVLQAALAVQQAEENIGIAGASDKPQVAVTGGNNWSDDSFPGLDNRRWSVGAGVSFKFYDGGATKAKVNTAKQDLVIARENEQKTRETVQLAVKQAYLNVRSAAQKVEATQTAVAQAEESFKIARVRYQAGVGINLDVLDAQLNLNKAKTNHIQALYDYNVGIASLEQAMGVDVRSGVVHPSLQG